MKKAKSGWLAPKRSAGREAELNKLTKKMIKTDIQRMNVLVPARLYAEFKIRVMMRRMNISDVIIELIHNYVDEEVKRTEEIQKMEKMKK